MEGLALPEMLEVTVIQIVNMCVGVRMIARIYSFIRLE
jgi:hypothetical protein